MTLRWTYEKVCPTDDHTAVCYYVEDCDTGEVIYKTAHRERANELCKKFNDSRRNAEAVERMQNQLSRSEDAYRRLKGRYADCIAALKAVATCRKCDDCATCPSLRTCNPMVSRLVATARKALLDCGRKVPKGEEASDANRD